MKRRTGFGPMHFQLHKDVACNVPTPRFLIVLALYDPGPISTQSCQTPFMSKAIFMVGHPNPEYATGISVLETKAARRFNLWKKKWLKMSGPREKFCSPKARKPMKTPLKKGHFLTKNYQPSNISYQPLSFRPKFHN